MKRVGYLFEQIVDPENLRKAFYKAQKGKSSNTDVQLFRINLEHNISNLYTALTTHTLNFGNYHYFTIYEPKKRIICAADFSERVIHHAIINICGPYFNNHQLPNSYACQTEKGTFKALEQVSLHQKKYKWYLKMDVRKYFDNINHEVLFGKLNRLFKDSYLLELLWDIVDSYHATDNNGLPIGNLTSQYFANHYLSFADKYIVHELKNTAYVRYMDDMLLWGNDRNRLRHTGQLVSDFLSDQLRLTLKPSSLNRTEHGLPALGFVIYPHKIRLNQRSKKRFLQKMKQYNSYLQNDIITEENYARHFWALYGFISHAHCHAFLKTTIQKTGSDIEVSNRVLRGGSWNNNAQNCRSSNRNNNTPGNRNNNNGFRLACSTQPISFVQMSASFPVIWANSFLSYPFSSKRRTTDKSL